MTDDWRGYQEKSADFFRSLGFDATVDAKIAGARAKHRIDVWVTFNRYGLDHRWVVECKYWQQRNIPKKEVETLRTIVNEVGADRGFLLSEVGFQSGAVQAAQNTNITLTSLADLRLNAESGILRSTIIILNRVVLELRQRIMNLQITERPSTNEVIAKPKPGVDGNALIRTIGELSVLQWGLDAAALEQFPAFYRLEGEQSLYAADLRSLVRGSQRVIARISDWVERQEEAAERTGQT